MSSTPLLQRNEHERFLSAGYSCSELKEILYDTKIYDVVQYSKKLSSTERITQFVKGVFLGTLSFCIIPTCSDTVYVESFVEPFKGESTRIRMKYNLKKTREHYDKLSAEIGFSPLNRQSIIKYLQTGNNLDGFYSHLGHRFKPFFIPKTSYSGIFFIPNNDISQATVIQMSTQEDQSLTSGQLLRGGYAICESYKPGTVHYNNLKLKDIMFVDIQ